MKTPKPTPRKEFDLCEAGMPVADHAHHVLRYRFEAHVEKFIERKVSGGLHFFLRGGIKEGVYEEGPSGASNRQTAYMIANLKFTYHPRPQA